MLTDIPKATDPETVEAGFNHKSSDFTIPC